MLVVVDVTWGDSCVERPQDPTRSVIVEAALALLQYLHSSSPCSDHEKILFEKKNRRKRSATTLKKAFDAQDHNTKKPCAVQIASGDTGGTLLPSDSVLRSFLVALLPLQLLTWINLHSHPLSAIFTGELVARVDYAVNALDPTAMVRSNRLQWDTHTKCQNGRNALSVIGHVQAKACKGFQIHLFAAQYMQKCMQYCYLFGPVM
ncbi:hypothetical protein B0H13DRAFT_2281513 [Mycena leptocephala]|nr:hypothetical protein B0H13DRAFT_2281513 [Mycena leptocephala]